MLEVLKLHAALELDDRLGDVCHLAFGVGGGRKLADLGHLKMSIGLRFGHNLQILN